MMRDRRDMPMCKWADEKIGPEDKTDGMTATTSGEDVPVTRFSDGSFTVHWGGPCGSETYDEYGNEC